MYCAYLLTLSEYFKWVELSDFGLSLRLAFAEGSIRMMKLEVRPLESALGVDSQDSKGEVLEYKVYSLVQLYNLMQFDFQDGS